MGSISEGKFEIELKGVDLDEYYGGGEDINFRNYIIEGVVEAEGTYDISASGADDVYSYGANWKIIVKSVTPAFNQKEIDLLSMNGKDWKTELESHLEHFAYHNNDYDFC